MSSAVSAPLVTAADLICGRARTLLMSERLVLRCAISQARLTDPAKGQGCGHAAQCNYAVLCDHINLTRACPVCHVHVRREREVVRDDALRVGLSQLPAEARAAWLRSVGDGRWLRPEAVDGTRIQVTGLNLELNGCKGKIVRQSEEGLYEVRLDPAVGNDPKGARAVMGLRASAPLPEGWKECVDKSTGDSYYYNASTSTTTWERPAASGRAPSSTEVQKSEGLPTAHCKSEGQWAEVEIGAAPTGEEQLGKRKPAGLDHEARNLAHLFAPGWKDATAGPVNARRVRKKPGAPEYIGCFCTTQRHLKTNDLPFEGLWIQCEECTRWCHAECIGRNAEELLENADYYCPTCRPCAPCCTCVACAPPPVCAPPPPHGCATADTGGVGVFGVFGGSFVSASPLSAGGKRSPDAKLSAVDGPKRSVQSYRRSDGSLVQGYHRSAAEPPSADCRVPTVDILVGGAVQVARSDSEHLGQRGRVVSAKSGYYQVQLPGPTRAHFRGRDLLLLDEPCRPSAAKPPPADCRVPTGRSLAACAAPTAVSAAAAAEAVAAQSWFAAAEAAAAEAAAAEAATAEAVAAAAATEDAASVATTEDATAEAAEAAATSATSATSPPDATGNSEAAPSPSSAATTTLSDFAAEALAFALARPGANRGGAKTPATTPRKRTGGSGGGEATNPG